MPLKKRQEKIMQERLVDVSTAFGNVIHTYPITLSESEAAAGDAPFEAKALEAAHFGRLVPDDELETLRATMHIARSGPMEPYGDDVAVMSETRSSLIACIREAAYTLWQLHGEAKGNATEDWLRARHHLLQQRAYTLWEEDGCPAHRADEYWFRTMQFESC